jgi:sugar phosphate isomerase/epimerase
MSDFIREKVCFYSSVLKGQNSSWQIARSAAAHGVAGLELMNFSDGLKTPDMKAAKEIGAFAKAQGLALPCFSCGVNFAEDTKARLENIKRYADICSELEIPYLHHTLIMTWDSAATEGRVTEMIDLAAECALEINDYAAQRGVKTLVEDQGYVVNGVTRYSEFMKKTDGRIGVLLDFGNIMFMDEGAVDFYAAFPDVKHIHVKDFTVSDTPLKSNGHKSISEKCLDYCGFGEGDVDMDTLAAMLKKNGYNGYYSSEFLPFENDEAVKDMLLKMSKTFG